MFFAITIIITAYLPIYTLQSVEGKLFRPMAWTVAFALAGALLFSIIIAPVLASLLFRKGAKEWKNPAMEWLTARYRKALSWANRSSAGSRSALPCAGFALTLYLAFSGVIGSEFLPHLDEGAIWARGSLAPSTGPDESLAHLHTSSPDHGCLPRGYQRCRPDWAARRRHRLDRLLQYRIQHQSEAQRRVAPGLSSGQGRCSDLPP